MDATLNNISPQILNVREAGRLGGQATLRNKGRSYYSDIGKLGQLAMRRKYPKMASIWGKKGGRPKKKNLNNIMGEKGK